MDGEIMWFGLPSSKYRYVFISFLRRRRRVPGHRMRQKLYNRAATDFSASGAIDVGQLLSHILPVEEIDEACISLRTHDARTQSIGFTIFGSLQVGQMHSSSWDQKREGDMRIMLQAAWLLAVVIKELQERNGL